MKTGTVAIIGRPNAGKSSLINALLKTHAVIISPKPQTTRNLIRCIYNDSDSQIIFTDTPGVLKPDNKLGHFLNDSILDALDESDLIIWLIDSSTKKLTPEDLQTSELINAQGMKDPTCRAKPVILAANKSDKFNASKAITLYESLCKFTHKISISARTKSGLDELITLVKDSLTEGPLIYDPDILMDTTERFMAAEIIREKVLMLLRDEVPHCVAIEIDEYKSPDEFPERKKLYIRASLITETEGQKKIIIGANGSMIKKIGETSRESLEQVTGFPVFLDLWAKVIPGWRKNNLALKRLGYA